MTKDEKYKKEIKQRNTIYTAKIKKAEKQHEKDQIQYNKIKDDPEKRIDMIFNAKSNINL